MFVDHTLHVIKSVHVSANLERINFLLLSPKFHIMQLVGLNRLVAARERLWRNVIENWLHHPEKVISRNCGINLVTRNSTHDNGTKTIREHSIHQAQTIAALAGSKDFLANCFLVHVFKPLSLSFFLSLSLSLSLSSASKILFFFHVLFLLPYLSQAFVHASLKVVGPVEPRDPLAECLSLAEG